MFTKSSQKHTVKETSDSHTLSFDLLSNLTYMAAASYGGGLGRRFSPGPDPGMDHQAELQDGPLLPAGIYPGQAHRVRVLPGLPDGGPPHQGRDRQELAAPVCRGHLLGVP